MEPPLPNFVPRSEGGRENVHVSPGWRAPTAATYWRTLRHLRWSQLGYLALRRALPRAHSPAAPVRHARLRELPDPWPFPEWQPEASRRMLATRAFTFLNRTVAGHGSIPWNDRRHAKLWLYHLNYFDFLNVSLAVPAEEPLLNAALEIMLDWRRHNAAGTEAGWEPYALSVRIVNWLKFLARYRREVEMRRGAGTLGALLSSVGSQAATLEGRLEKDLLGNHLLKNIKALLFAGALIECSRSARWWAAGQKLLARELDEQILADGGHIERSPMYHAQALADLADIQGLCALTEKELPCAARLAEKVRAMEQFLGGIAHPDGGIPLFNDSSLDGAPPAGDWPVRPGGSATARPSSAPHVALYPHTGYGVIRNAPQTSALIFDAGPLGPDYQPGHGHCDLLSYELSLDGQRVVVDTGVSTYERTPARLYERSTAAHNTLRIDGEEQAEVWASFRVGRRPRAGEIRAGRVGDFRFITGEHDAYRRLGVVHARTVLFRAPDTWVVADLLRGRGAHRLESFLHFHSRVRVEPVAEPMNACAALPMRCWKLEFGQPAYLLAAYGAGQFDVLESWHAERFGERQRSTVIRCRWKATLPTGMLHVFHPAGCSLPQIAADWAGKAIAIDGHTIPLS